MKKVLSFGSRLEKEDEQQPSMREPSSLSVHFREIETHFGGTRALAPASGDIFAGELTALMGPSGAGKSTLLNALCKRGPVTKGDLWYSDGDRALAWSKALKKHLAFVEQDDHCLENLTVRETLFYAARLRLPKAPLKEKRGRVDETIAVLRLGIVAESKVGSALVKGISGGERKRLMIGQELLTNPKLIALDEPTSGLDSSLAAVVAEALRDLAEQKNVAVVASLHQPSSRIFLNCHNLFLLDRQGVIYRGPTEPAGDAFAEKPFYLPRPKAFSAPDWLMEIVVNGDFTTDNKQVCPPPSSSSSAATQQRSRDDDDDDDDDLEAAGAADDTTTTTKGPSPNSSSDGKEEVDVDVGDTSDVDDEKRVQRRAEVDRLYGASSLEPTPLQKEMHSVRSARRSENYVVPFSEQVRVLFMRTWKEVWPSVFDKNAMILHSGNATIAGLLWFQLGYNERDIWPKLTLAFAVPIAWVFFPLLSSLSVVPSNEVMLKKELSSNSYMLGAWYLVVTTVLLAPMLVHSIIHVSLVFALSNLGNLLVWLAVYGTVVLSLITFQSIGLMFSAAIPAGNLMTCAMLYVTYCFLFIGLFVDLDDIPVPEIALPNPMLYIMSLTAHSVFSISDRRFDCNSNNLDDEGTAFPRSCLQDDDVGGGDGKIAAPEILREYRLKFIPPYVAFVVLVAFMAVSRFLAYVILRRRMDAHLRAMRSYQ